MPAALAVFGFGAMGSAIVRGACDARVLEAASVLVVEPEESRRREAADLGCMTAGDSGRDLEANHILLAVKPQRWDEVAAALGPLAHPSVVTSIMAGIASERIRAALGENARVVRAMPNTACRIGAGATALARGAGAGEADTGFPRSLFSALGVVVEVEERLLDAVTALSGSGPAYVILLAEAMEQAGVQMGIGRATARTLAYHTVLGAGLLLTETWDVVADVLRAQVTSPGGTTAAAMEVLFERELPQIVAEAIIAARDRGEELGNVKT